MSIWDSESQGETVVLNQVLILAVNMQDAQAECQIQGLKFKDIIWLLDPAYMPDMNFETWEVIKTAAYIDQEGELP